MKKVLFATTALIATAGMAAADVRLSGYGRFGLDYNSANERTAGVSETNITSRLRLQVDMSTETDGGIGFNARVRMQSESRDGNPAGSAGTAGDSDGPALNGADELADDNGFNGARFGVTYGGLAVNVGNIIGAVENAPGLFTTGTRSAGTGIDGMGFHSVVIKSRTGTAFNWDAYSSDGMGANGIEALYSMGGFTGHISYSQQNGGTVLGKAGGEDRTGIMLTYSFSDYYVTAAAQSSSVAANDVTFVAAGGDFGAFGARLAYGSTDAADSVTLEGNMDIGAASNILVWVNSTDVSGVVTAADTADGTSFGINYQYDLGGGATFVAGYVDEADDDNQFQAGVYFSF
ncbi:porin [Pseudophaeobacter sp. EL27]|uniref:porin n=1 Tax=Pseudophaeobacter sp. EL27 TaxID=2107580 RepID=UPI000EFBADBB|nr:porin [Pseudophaeobacter sp. EL27]